MLEEERRVIAAYKPSHQSQQVSQDQGVCEGLHMFR